MSTKTEQFTCDLCFEPFEREVKRGAKPQTCGPCKAAIAHGDTAEWTLIEPEAERRANRPSGPHPLTIGNSRARARRAPWTPAGSTGKRAGAQ